MATPLTPAQQFAGYNAVMANPDLDPDLAQEFREIYERTEGFTNVERCASRAANMGDLLELADYNPQMAVVPPTPPTPPTHPTPPVAPKSAGSKPGKTGKPGEAGKKGKPGRKGKDSNDSKKEKEKKEEKPLNPATASADLVWGFLQVSNFRPGDRVQVLPADQLPADELVLEGEHDEDSTPDAPLAPIAGKTGTVESVGVDQLAPKGSQKVLNRAFAIVRFDDGTKHGGKTADKLSYISGKIPQLVLRATATPATAAPAAPAPVLLGGMDDEACRLLVASNNRKARVARQVAELADFKAAKIAGGMEPAVAETLTQTDMRKKRTLSDIVKGPSEHLIHSVSRHLGSKSERLKKLPEKYEKMRVSLEQQAAEHVAEFAKQQAKWVNDTLVEALQHADEQVPEAAAN